MDVTDRSEVSRGATDRVDLSTDGGEDVEQNMFTRTANVPEMTTGDRVKRLVDSYLLTPLSIATSDYRTLIGGSLLLGFVLLSTVGVYVTPRPSPMEGPIYLSPFQDLAHPLGTDVMGNDLLKMVIHASPDMLLMILAGSTLSVVVGTLIGTIAGYKGGTIDQFLMSITDIVLTIPGLVLVIVIASIYPPTDPIIVGLILGIDTWPGLARTLRSQVLSIREEAYTEASRIMGLSQWHILRKDIITNLMPYISINFADSARNIVFQSVALYFLGILPFTSFNWGVMMNEAYEASNLTDPSQIHWLLVPMMMIVIVSLGFILFAQGLDRVFNVRLQSRHATVTGGDEDTESDAEETEVTNVSRNA